MPTSSRLIRQSRAREDSGPYVAPGMRVAAAWSWRVLVVLAAAAAAFEGLSYFSELLIPLLVSMLLCALLGPLVDLLGRHRWPRVLATLVVLFATILVVVGLLTLVGTQVATGFSGLSDQAVQGLSQVQSWLKTGPLHVSNGQLNDYLSQISSAVTSNNARIVSSAVVVGGAATRLLTGLFLAFFISIFLLYDGRKVWSWLVHLLPSAAVAPLDGAARRGWVTLTAYVRATVIVAFVDALGVGIGASILHIPLAIPLAVLVFLAAFIPIVGALVSGAVAVLVGLVSHGLVVAVIMLGVVLLVQLIESHVLQPFLLGRAVSVHPLAVIMSIAAGSTLAGIPGALFAVPTVAVLNTIIGHLVRDDLDETDAGGVPEGSADAPLAPNPANGPDVAPPPADQIPEGASPKQAANHEPERPTEGASVASRR